SPEPCDPVQIARSVAALLRPQAEAKRLELSLEAAPGMDGARLDPMRLRQCLFNIIGNAVKFTQAGGVAVRLAYVGAAAARRLRCEVQDTGVGVPEAARTTLFDRFQQADGGTTRKFGGTGLGLAITRRLVELHGGTIGVTSTPGVGSTFTVTLPIVAAALQTEGAPGAEPVSAARR
ncbi:MAG: hybrid sensor histidine kinase/response regulator, partial [Thermomicrobiales bacterium]|nr:hybrid sensor histidine kinase/response regulator [Thermomicrobiales bacterium]